MAESFLLGRNAKAYFNTNGSLIGEVGVGPSVDEFITEWLDDATGDGTVVAGNLTDVTLNLASDFADATTRGTAASGFSSSVPVLKNGEVTFEARWLPTDPAVTPPPFAFTTLLRNAWENDGRIAVVFLDQDRANPGAGNTVAPQGLAANWSVSMDINQALRDIQRMSITLTIADSASWYSETIVGT